MKILVCGSRTWTAQTPIYRELRALPIGTIVVHGAARGADSIAANLATQMGFIVRPYPADWERYGTRAGPIRNSEILVKEHLEHEPINLVLAFALGLDQRSGTSDMVRKAVRVGIEVKLVQ
jgi:hypothetical protein